MLKYILPFSFFFAPTFAGELSSQGEIAFEYRRFKDDDQKSTVDFGQSLFTRLQATWEKDSYKHHFRAFGRVDREDDSRSLLAIEDAYLSKAFGEEEDFVLSGGYKIFNWTATEAFHPSDVINSRNFDSNLESLEKKGELTLEAELGLENGSLNFFFWPRFEEASFPGASSRLGTGANLGEPLVIYDGRTKKNWQPQGGLQFSYTFDSSDLGLHLIHHVDRTFPLVGTHQFAFNPFLQSNLPNDLVAFTTGPTPYYFKVNQAGATYQHALGPWLLKIEGAYRDYMGKSDILTARGVRSPEDHWEAALGLEYGLTHNSGSESTFILEATSIEGVDESRGKEMSAFQHDGFLGYRYAANDVWGKEFFLGWIKDLKRSDESMAFANYSQRLNDKWKVKAGVRTYWAPPKNTIPTGLEVLHKDHEMTLTLAHFF
jgi:hypothetical protein